MKVKNLLIGILSMAFVSAISLLILSVLTYMLKLQADKAMLGITLTYILTGFAGGLALKLTHIWSGRKREADVQTQKENVTISKKMFEAIISATIYMGLLLLLSVVLVQGGFSLSGRFLMIWMLLTGSACLGRIL